MDESLYNVTAKIPPGSTHEEYRLMLQSLLAERFRMAVHINRREMTSYELKVGKDGLKCKESGMDPAPTNGIVQGDYQQAGGRVVHKAKQTMEELAFYLTIKIGQPVIDATNVKGRYEIALDYVQEPSRIPHPPAVAVDQDVGPTLPSALKTQLGLQLESRKHTIDTLIIDHIERVPTEN
jgi:uncharacterized protein (TIGR03435 family)